MTPPAVYNPFSYQPWLQFFYNGAGHIEAAIKLRNWLKSRYPSAYEQMRAKRPDLFVDAAFPMVTPNISLPANRMAGLSGLGDDGTTPVSTWGHDFLDLAKSIVQVKGQNDIIQLNIARAERGLPPIDSGAVAPQVNFGLSDTTTKLVIGSVVVLGVAAIASSVLGKRK